MFLKKITLTIILIISGTTTIAAENDSKTLLGDITRKECQDFIFGLILGSLHGHLNVYIENKIPSASEQDSFEFLTLLTSIGIHIAYNKTPEKGRTIQLLGHGIGQLLAETLSGNINKLRWNSLITVSLLSMLTPNKQR